MWKSKSMAFPLLLIFSISLLFFHGRSQSTFSSLQSQEREFECVDIYKQPSLQHPQLKNHQIQMRPSNELLTMLSSEGSSEHFSNNEAVADFDIPNEGCPKGQVPIHKPKNSNYTRKHSHSNGYGIAGQHAAVIQKTDPTPWRGASAWISIYQPKVTKDQFSMVMIWVNGEYNGERNTIQFGWAVDPELYGDNRTRLTTYWRPENIDNGCYNLLCKGFIQLQPRIHFGAPFSHVSVAGGMQYHAFFSVNQDPKTQNWFLTYDKRVFIGYWPGELLPYLTDGAEVVRYGGFTSAPSENLDPVQIVSPPMGSGNKPSEDKVDLTHTCYMHVVKYVTMDYKWVDIDSNKVAEDADAGRCYDAIYHDNVGFHRQTFTFGGPGGLCDV